MPATLHSPAGGPAAMSRLPPTPSDYVSPATRRSIGLTSPVVTSGGPTKVMDNDDAAERRQRRKSRLLELQRKTLCSPSTPPSDRRRSTPLSGLSNAQLTDHYANCIKLSAENKINAKNAFGLHLIDYMTDLLKKKEMTNFQVASSTLDASAKIYAGRVDAIHSETYKVLTGLGRGANTKDDDDGGDMMGDDAEHETKKKKRVVHNKQTVETNLKNINVKKFDLEFEVDPLFQKMSAAFDEGGSGGLLLNHLSCLDETSELYLDSNTVVPGLEEEQPEAAARNMVDLREFRDIYSGMNLEALQICPAFADFEFSNWNKDGDSTFSSMVGKLSGKGDHAFDLEAEPEPILSCGAGDATSMAADFGTMDENYDDGGGNDDFEGGSQCLGDATQSEQPFFGDGSEAKLVEAAFENMKHGTVGTLMQILAAEPSDYSYFNTNLLRTWAGPQHWKLNPKSKESNLPGAAGEKGKKERKKVEAFKTEYEEEVNFDKNFKETRAAVTLTKATLDKNSKVPRTLPEDLHYDAEKFFKVFNKSKIMVKRQKKSAVQDIDSAIETYDYNNANDRDNFCPAELERADDQDDDDDNEGGFNFTSGSDVHDMSSQGSFVADNTMNNTALLGDNLVQQPRKVAQVDIGYARTAKKMDVRKLKSTMWTMLTKAEENKISLQENEDAKKEEQKKEVAGELKFTEMITELPEKVSKNMAKNLSVPIAFVCLLHLANEKTLKITSDETMSDLVICQG